MRVIWSVLSIAAVAYLGLAAYLYLFQERYVYFPSEAVAETPAAVGLGYDDVRFQSDDGMLLRGWFVPAAGARFTLLFCHGNGGNISHRLDSLRIFHRLGLSVFIFDYRGYGQSTGKPSEQGTYRDAEAAWRYLVKNRGIPAPHIIDFGRSLGAGVATWLAMEHPPRALILESAFTSVPDMGAALYPFLPVRALSRIRYNTLRRIASVHRPLLVIHSRDDEIVPFAHGRRIFEAANQPKTFLEIHGSHNNGFLASIDDYSQGLADFVRTLALEPAPPEPAPPPPGSGEGPPVAAPPAEQASPPAPESSPAPAAPAESAGGPII